MHRSPPSSRSARRYESTHRSAWAAYGIASTSLSSPDPATDSGPSCRPSSAEGEEVAMLSTRRNPSIYLSLSLQKYTVEMVNKRNGWEDCTVMYVLYRYCITMSSLKRNEIQQLLNRNEWINVENGISSFRSKYEGWELLLLLQTNLFYSWPPGFNLLFAFAL